MLVGPRHWITDEVVGYGAISWNSGILTEPEVASSHRPLKQQCSELLQGGQWPAAQ